jgi:hypothetical protein
MHRASVVCISERGQHYVVAEAIEQEAIEQSLIDVFGS